MLNYTQYVCKHGCSERKCEICENESMDAKLASALKALEDYAQHSGFCAAVCVINMHGQRTWPPLDAEGCDCGLTQAWRSLNK